VNIMGRMNVKGYVSYVMLCLYAYEALALSILFQRPFLIFYPPCLS